MISRPIDFDSGRGGADNDVPMECTLALLADAANREEGGKLNVLGVFDVIHSDKFPYAMPQFYVVVRLTAGPAEFGSKKAIELVLLDPDGKVLGRIPGKANVPTPDAGGRANMEVILRMVGVPFPKPGSYAIAVLVNGEQKHSIPIEVVQVKPSTGRRGRKSSG